MDLLYKYLCLPHATSSGCLPYPRDVYKKNSVLNNWNYPFTIYIFGQLDIKSSEGVNTKLFWSFTHLLTHSLIY